MEWKEIVPFVVALSAPVLTTVAMWWRLDSKFDTKFDALNKLLTDNLLEMKGDIGELKGQAHTR